MKWGNVIDLTEEDDGTNSLDGFFENPQKSKGEPFYLRYAGYSK